VAAQATVHRFVLQLSDVDRQVYESLDLRVARHPSETVRYLLARTFAYALSYEDGIAFSKGGLSETDEPPVAVRDPTGVLRAWIDVGAPSAERLHKATKAAERVAVFTHHDVAHVRRAAAARAIHKVETIEVWCIDPGLLDALEPRVLRHTSWDVLRSDGHLYVTDGATTLDGPLTRASLVE
jgi:uncharacterized protein YaeQ